MLNNEKKLMGAKERILSAMGQSSEPEKASSSDNNLKSHKDLSNNNQSDEGRYLKNSNQPEPWQSSAKDQKGIQCWRCNGFGHRAADRECPLRLTGRIENENFYKRHEDPMYSDKMVKREEALKRVEYYKKLLAKLKKKKKDKKRKRERYESQKSSRPSKSRSISPFDDKRSKRHKSRSPSRERSRRYRSRSPSRERSRRYRSRSPSRERSRRYRSRSPSREGSRRYRSRSPTRSSSSSRNYRF